MTKRQIYKKFDNSTKKELNAKKKNKKKLMSKMMSWLLLLNDVEGKKQEVWEQLMDLEKN